MVFLLAFVGMACWGIAPLFVKLGLKDVNPLVGLSIRTAFTIMILMSLMFVNGSITQLKNVSWTVFVLLAIEAIFATIIGDLAYFAAIKRGSVAVVTIIMSSSPLITIICSVLFLGEQVTIRKVVGAGLIILGIIVAI